MFRWDIINDFIQRRNYRSFLEIGTATGDTFRRVSAMYKVSVDPDPSTNATCIETSDSFFASSTEHFDIIFIDGLHLCDQVYRDIRNGLRHLNPGGTIILHDCNPGNNYAVQIPRPYIARYGPWAGDTWKAFVKARAELPYEMYVITHDCGCGVIDTTIPKLSSTANMPTNMSKMSFSDFCNHPEWMNFQDGILILNQIKSKEGEHNV